MAEAGRVIAGRAKGVRLLAPGPGTRPFADRVKQTLFAILEPDLPDAVVVDLFAGSGAAGIEALSRGAATAVFVERDPGAARTIAENLRRAGLAGEGARVDRSDVVAWLGRPHDLGRSVDLAIVDPPYGETALLVRSLELLGRGRLLAPGGRVAAKHFWRDRPPDRIGMLALERERRFGETALSLYRLVDVEEAP